MLKQNIDLFLHGLSGSLGSVIAVALLFPIDNIKIRMQIE